MADMLDNFEVVARWTNVGSADLFLSCNVCVWFYEWDAEGIDRSAPLAEVVAAAAQHWTEVHDAQLALDAPSSIPTVDRAALDQRSAEGAHINEEQT